MAGPSPLRLYRIAAQGFGFVAPAFINWRRRQGKEDPTRQDERLGHPGIERPDGALVWLHGASVGEAIALLPLVERLTARGFQALVSTGTTSSANVLARRLPAGAVHQYVPYDAPRFVARFLDHWQPDLVLLAESELWPNLVFEIAERRIPLVLVNARMSERSFTRWLRLPRTIYSLLDCFDLCLAQSRDDAARLIRLGAPRVRVAGNLKYDVAAPPVDPVEFARHIAAVGPRPLWVAASTHAGEEAMAARAHRALRQKVPDLLTIVVPRHPPRGGEIAAEVAALGITPTRRASGAPIDRTTEFYIADTIGETGLYYRLSNIVFVGRSLCEDGGGQNPIEPAKLGAAILHGPRVENFVDVYRALDDFGGAIEVGDETELPRAVAQLLNDTAFARATARIAGETVERLGGATDTILEAIEPLIARVTVATD